MIELDRAADRCGQRAIIDPGELHAGGDACRTSRQIGVDHRIGQAAGARHHRHAAIGETVKLRQAARFEPAGHQDRIAAALQPVRQGLVIPDPHPDAARMARSGSGKVSLHRSVARTQHRQPPADPDQMVDHFEQHVDALLPGQPADHDEQRPGAGLKPEFGFERSLVGGALAQGARSVTGGQVRIAGWVPLGRVDPVDDPAHPRPPADHQPFQPHPEFSAAHFARVSRADRGDLAGGFHPGFQKAHAAVIFHPVKRPGRFGQAQLLENSARVKALKGHVVDGHHAGHGFATGQRGKAQVGQRQPGLPIMRMDQIELAGLDQAAGQIRRRAA